MEYETIKVILYDSEIYELPNDGKVPLSIQIRMELNKRGFRFQDDHLVSSIINENPIPLGRATRVYDFKNCCTIFTQIIPKE